ncbi:MAG TPA: cupin domain-containing protein [Rhabdochlamydiaceae bacterium]|nr:cupin domain-containing protein [Rhabdochlamydiaceae bacterium]
MMRKTIIKKNAVVIVALFATAMISSASLVADEPMPEGEIKPVVVKQFLAEAKKNKNWKTAIATGKHEQIVFMNICLHTNPNNEIGTEVHPFDQVILIVEGQGKVVMNGSSAIVQSGDMVFIPEGKSHNVINFDDGRALKLISFYSNIVIPKDAAYKTKADEL